MFDNTLIMNTLDELLYRLRKIRFLLIYGKPIKKRKKLLISLLAKLSEMSYIHIFDLSYEISPEDLLGYSEETLKRIFIYHLNLTHLSKLLNYIPYLNLNNKHIIIINPFYVQGSLSTTKEFDTIYCLFSLKKLLIKNIKNVIIWFIVNTTFEDIKKLSFFRNFGDEFEAFLLIKIINSEAKILIFNKEKNEYIIKLPGEF